jgi:hypothetical protein
MQQNAVPSSRTSDGVIDYLFQTFLARDRRGAQLRAAVLLTAFLAYWLTLAFYADFPQVLPQTWLDNLVFPLNVGADLVTSLFAPAVLLHLIPVAAAFWIGLRLAAHYLADLFELETPGIASSYLAAAALGINHDTLHIAQGDVNLLSRNSPMLRIGGPGYLKVDLGFAVVMETSEGLPRVYGPQQRRFVEGFERLRDVIDLRDQLRELAEVRAVTADGIEVRARDVQMVFRVYGGGQDRSLEIPYPYTENAIRRLVYGRPVAEGGQPHWTEELTSLAEEEIRSFVAGLTFEAFLALQPSSADLPGDAAPESRDQTGAVGRIHIPRRQLTERFHTEKARSRLRERGLELDWVGVGTWEIGSAEEPASISVGKTIVGAWQNVQRSQLLRSPTYLKRQRERGYQEGIQRPLESWIAVWRADDLSGRHRCWALLQHVFKQLNALADSLRGEAEATVPVGFDDVLEYLASLTKPQQLRGRNG